MLVEYLHDGAGNQRLSPFFVSKFFRKIFQGTYRHVAAGLSAIAQSNIGGEEYLISSYRDKCYSEPTPSRVLCRTRLFGHSRSAKEGNGVNRGPLTESEEFSNKQEQKKNNFSLCRVPQKISLAESRAFTRLGGDTSLSLSMTTKCHSERM